LSNERLFDAVALITISRTARQRPGSFACDLCIKSQTTFLIAARARVIDALTELLVSIFTATYGPLGARAATRVSATTPTSDTGSAESIGNFNKGITALLISVAGKSHALAPTRLCFYLTGFDR
jgi:hypothetical protein